MIAEMQSAYATQQPLLVMFWEPHWVHSEMDFDWIEFPEYTDDCDTNASVDMYPERTGDCGFKQAHISKIVSRNFATDWPGAFEIMDALSVDNATQNALLLQVDFNKRDLEEVVAEWMANNEAIWRPWVDAAKSAPAEIETTPRWTYSHCPSTIGAYTSRAVNRPLGETRGCCAPARTTITPLRGYA